MHILPQRCSLFQILVIGSLFFARITLLQAQSPYLDTLRSQLSRTSDTLEQIDLQIYLAHYLSYTHRDSTKIYADNIIQLSKAIASDSNLIFGYQKFAMAYFPNQLDSCDIYLDSMLYVAQRSNNYRGVTLYHQFKASVYRFADDYEQSVHHFLITLERSEAINDTSVVVSVINSFAIMHAISGKHQKAIDLIDEYDAYIYSRANKHFYYPILFIKALSLIETVEYAESLRLFHEVLSPANISLGNEMKADSWQNVAFIHEELGYVDSAEYYYQRVIDLSLTKSDSIARYSYIRLGAYLMNKQKWNEAEMYLLKSLENSEHERSATYEARTLELLIKLYRERNEYDKALHFVERYTELKKNVTTKGLDHLLEKMLLEEELVHTKNEISLLKKQNLTKENARTLAIISAVTLCMMFLYWFYQAYSVFRFSSEYSTRNNKIANSFWELEVTTNKLREKQKIISSLVMSVLLCLLHYLLVESVFGTTLVLFLLTFVVYYLGLSIYFRSVGEVRRTQVSDGGILLTLFVLSILVLYVCFTILTGRSFTEIKSITLLWLLTAVLSFVTTFALIIRYRHLISSLTKDLLYTLNNKIEETTKHKAENETTCNNKELILDNGGESLKINPNRLLYVVSDNVYQEFVCFENNEVSKTMVRSTMSNIVTLLKPYPNFFKCHRSYIVNTNMVSSIDGPSQKYHFTLKHCEEQIPISRAAAKEISSLEVENVS